MITVKGKSWNFQIQSIVTPSAKNKEPTLSDAMGIHTIGLRCMNKHRPGHLNAPTYNGYFDLKLNRRSFMNLSPRHVINKYAIQFPSNDGYGVQEITHVIFINSARYLSLVCGLHAPISMEEDDTISFSKGQINLYIVQ